MRSSDRHQRLLGMLSGFGLAILLACCAAATVVETQCLPMVEYTAVQQSQMLSAYHALPQGSILRRAIMDYLALRDANRACRGVAR